MKKGNEAKKKRTFKNLVLIFLAVLVIILIFTFIDYLIHQLKEEYAVPSYYFGNKIIFGTIIGLVAYLLVRKKNLPAKSLIFSAIISILLQVRYYLEGYQLSFVLEFLLFHFLILLVLSLIIFRRIDNKKGKI